MDLHSEIPGFYKLSVQERIALIKKLADLTDDEANVIANTGGLPMEVAERMVENVIGAISVPMGIAVNFKINEKDYLIPMALEEPSVVSSASGAAKMARAKGGFVVSDTGPFMIGQIQVVDVPDPDKARAELLARRDDIMRRANEEDPSLVSQGGGAKEVGARVLSTSKGPMVVAELVVNTGDTMGRNVVNAMADAVAPLVEELTGGRVFLRIVSNLADRSLVRASAVFDKETIGGEEVVDRIIYAYAFAEADQYRCVTHNKGIMNGVVAVGIACGQDIRALEAGAHSYASRTGKYKPLTTWEKDANGDLVGRLEMPLAVGLVGGVSGMHPAAQVAVKILGVTTAVELAEVMGAVGLAENFAYLRFLATKEIRRNARPNIAARSRGSIPGSGSVPRGRV